MARITQSAELLDSIAELRRAVPIDLELTGLDRSTEEQLVDDLASRILPAPANAPAVCLLDTGVDSGHPLLKAAVDPEDVHSCFGDDLGDRYGTGDWHGTGSAGLAVFGLDLGGALVGRAPWQHRHHLESVKIIPSSAQLSYFVEPNPGKRGIRGSDRIKILNAARYPSFGLRFDVATPGETPEQLMARVNAAAPAIEGRSKRGDLADWRLGNKRTRGSLHSDVWMGTAAKLANKSAIVVYPVNGWWRFRPKDHDVCERKARYALVVSIETDAEGVDIYTAVENLVSTVITA